MPAPPEVLSADAPLKGEGGRAFAAFTLYRDLGAKRSLAEAAQLYHKRAASGLQTGGKKRPSGRINEWAKRWQWTEWVRLWDEQQNRQYVEEAEGTAGRGG